MRAVKAEVTSSNTISLSKADAIFSLFAASETGARPDIAAYLRRAESAFKELIHAHDEISHQGKISQIDEDEHAEVEGDSRRRKKKKEKERNSEVESHRENSTFKEQGLFNGGLGSVFVESNGVVKVNKVRQKEKRTTEAVEKKKGKKERKKEERKAEMKNKEVECNWKRSERRKNQKENQEEEGFGFDGSITNVRKKRKHSDVEHDGEEKKEHGREEKKKRRKAE